MSDDGDRPFDEDAAEEEAAEAYDEDDLDDPYADEGGHVAPPPPPISSADLLEERLKKLENFQFEAEQDIHTDKTGELAYRHACKEIDEQGQFFRFPIDSVVEQFHERDMDLSHSGLGDKGVKALAKAIEINENLRSLNLRDNWITPEGGKELLQVLVKHRGIQRLDLTDNRLGSVALGQMKRRGTGDMHDIDEVGVAGCLRNLMQKNTNLHEYVLRGNKMSDRDVAEIAVAVMDQPSILHFLDLSYNDIGPLGGASLQKIISDATELKEILLGWNRLGPTGCMKVLEGVSMTGTLVKIDLSWNGVNDEGGVLLGQCIAKSSSLAEVIATDNRMGKKAAEAIANALKDAATLERLVLNNNPFTDAGCTAIIIGLRQAPKSLKHVNIQSCGCGPDATREQEETKSMKPPDFSLLLGETLFSRARGAKSRPE